MHILIEKITVSSEDGDRNYPCTLDLRMDKTQIDCPITFYQDGKPVFSLAAEEIPAFCDALRTLDCSA